MKTGAARLTKTLRKLRTQNWHILDQTAETQVAAQAGSRRSEKERVRHLPLPLYKFSPWIKLGPPGRKHKTKGIRLWSYISPPAGGEHVTRGLTCQCVTKIKTELPTEQSWELPWGSCQWATVNPRCTACLMFCGILPVIGAADLRHVTKQTVSGIWS